MLEKSFGVTFFLKTPQNESKFRYVYLRITVDGTPKEMSTRRKWDYTRWDQKSERAIGTKEDAKSLNYFLDLLITKINNYRTELLNTATTVTAQKLMDFIQGKSTGRVKVLEEFELHNAEMLALVDTDEYALGTHTRFQITKDHVERYILWKYGVSDIDFRELNFEFIKDFEFYLKTEKRISHNTVMKYITNFKKIVLRAIAKKIIKEDPFILYKAKKNKIKRKPLSRIELKRLEEKEFKNERLSLVRDVFVFQCYTGLAYIDVKQLMKTQIREGIDGSLWIINNRQKTNAEINIPLLPKAMEIIKKYENNPLCEKSGVVLPVKSNQKMNAYLKEIADLCDITDKLTTHKARRTFGSTVTLNNGVPIDVVREMLGHTSVKQTEEYAITEQESVSREMKGLRAKLEKSAENNDDNLSMLLRLCNDFEMLKNQHSSYGSESDSMRLIKFEQELESMKKRLLQA